MAAPKAARTVTRGRIYTINGLNLWSVTTIIGNGLPKPAIARWQSNTIAEFAVANYRQLAAMLTSVRLRRWKTPGDEPDEFFFVTDPDTVAGAIKWLVDSPWRESKRKMDIGSAVHTEAEAYVLGVPRPEPDGFIAPYLQSFRHFLEDLEPEILASEATVYNPAESYAGTLDLIAGIGGRRFLIDIKTGKDIYPDVALQLAAYRYAEFVLLPDGTSEPMIQVDGAAGLHLREYDPRRPDDRGYSLIPVEVGQAAFDAFRYVREVMRWMEETSKGVLSQPITNPTALAALYPETETVKEVA